MTSRTATSARRSRRSALPLCALLASAALAATGCGERRGSPGAIDAAAEPEYGGTLVIASSTDLDAANGLVSTEVLTQEIIRYALFLPLIGYDERLEYEPVLARSWEMIGDTAVVFRLRDDVRWHDGTPTTAYDVAFTFERAKDPATGFANAGYFERWTAVEVVDSFTVRFRIEPHPDPLAGWPFVAIMPRHLLDSIPPERMRQAEFNRKPVGNGPFRFVSQRANDRWVFEANPDFPEALGGRPYLDRVVWRVIPENSAQATELLTGGVDLILGPRAIHLAELDAAPGVRAIVKPSRKYQLIAWNGQRAPFDDARVRRALTLAIDRQEMLTVLRGGYGTLASGPITPAHWAHDSTVSPLPYDPAAARELLEAAGFRDRDGDGILEDAAGRDFSFALTIPAGNEYNRSVAEMVQADLAEVGIRMTVRPLDFAALVAAVTSPARDFDAVVMAWEHDFRLDLADLFHSRALDGPYQWGSYANPELDRLLDEASATADREAARRLWARVQEILRDDQPWTFLYYTPDLFAIRDRVHGVRMDVRGAFTTLPRWWVAAGPTIAGEETGAEAPGAGGSGGR